MLLPLIGFIAGLMVSALAGAVVFALHPRWKATLPNMDLFVAGSCCYVMVLSVVYTRIVADESGMLQSTAAVVGYLALLPVAVLGGGIATTYMGRKLLNLK
ncbi:hypothetical protein SAMN00120144_3698 [Hymenobacter roseosalivarius DSM 11622]|uniref:Uncharacterized protein n=1 Tax=Hymenobacter roseosalivarius DSM 11622 TaxID=645990 RepID=A0A1W1W2J0_9BACT|nr:hypothetical protein [Hymenobacter roseosalivarius]SMB99611.1 hypothetical protein SAMN00120144_3698 [Hymenobacter roseosalivarius DSM 11622]